jgi:hypothetical protein
MEGTEIGGPQPAAAAFSFLARAGEAETGCGDRQRFELELEFVHCLANPGYLNCECKVLVDVTNALSSPVTVAQSRTHLL